MIFCYIHRSVPCSTIHHQRGSSFSRWEQIWGPTSKHYREEREGERDGGREGMWYLHQITPLRAYGMQQKRRLNEYKNQSGWRSPGFPNQLAEQRSYELTLNQDALVHFILPSSNCNKCSYQVFYLVHIFMNQPVFMITNFSFICCL